MNSSAVDKRTTVSHCRNMNFFFLLLPNTFLINLTVLYKEVIQSLLFSYLQFWLTTIWEFHFKLPTISYYTRWIYKQWAGTITVKIAFTHKIMNAFQLEKKRCIWSLMITAVAVLRLTATKTGWNGAKRHKDGLKYRQEHGLLLKTPNDCILNSD